MTRRLAALALVLPFLFNGLRVVCAEPPKVESARPRANDESALSEHCRRICPVQKHDAGKTSLSSPDGEDGPRGSICLLVANGEGCPTAEFAFVTAAPRIATAAATPLALAESVPDLPTLYRNPVLTSLFPPPKA
jgi:hypothetical protein